MWVTQFENESRIKISKC